MAYFDMDSIGTKVNKTVEIAKNRRTDYLIKFLTAIRKLDIDLDKVIQDNESFTKTHDYWKLLGEFSKYGEKIANLNKFIYEIERIDRLDVMDDEDDSNHVLNMIERNM